jgi:hypothetical protein
VCGLLTDATDGIVTACYHGHRRKSEVHTMKFPLQFQHLIVETFTRLGGRLLALVLLIWLVVLLINVSMTLTHAGAAAAIR